ncbi:putative late blight resistance protein homolog R1B-16 [Nicotiana tabacum]|uniref:Late blight resistance protein homolog R1B-16 n=1 Tax=Nicotiana tabacum TaxID=4097 RepID=A0AC58RTY2_TOBAC
MAYAAITSLMSTIQQSMQLTGHNLQSFYEKLESLIAITEKPCNNMIGNLGPLTRLEAKVIELACSTEDMVDSESRNVMVDLESRNVINIISRTISFWRLRFLLKQAIRDIDCTAKKWIGTQTNQDLKAQNPILPSTSERALEPENMMVGHENEFEMMQDQLARGASELEVVSIVGMGGIGKTTLANKIFSDPFIMSRFDIRAKVTISQEYCPRKGLLGLLSSITGKTDKPYEQQDDGQLKDRLQKLLKGRRYLIVVDDIWNEAAWDDIKLCFPDCNNRSRILLTTRNVEVAEYASSGKPPYQMRLLNCHESCDLLHKRVFLNECFPPEFEQLGKQIALNCKGLPLAIIVIAGLLSKIGKSMDEWQMVVENVSSLVSTDVDVQCMRVLALSYHHLPRRLKSCFLYFAIFPEDEQIFVNKLVELWAVEGFLKVDDMNNIEKVGEEFLKELIDRSLISIQNLSFDGKIESCGMHDLIRELCLREAQNMNFVNVIGEENDRNPCAQLMHFSRSRSRISIQSNNRDDSIEAKLAIYPEKDARSIICFRGHWFVQKSLRFKLVRVLDLALVRCSTFPSGILDLIHLRYLALTLYPHLESGKEIPSTTVIPPPISSLCYLQTFKLYLPISKNLVFPFILPSEILAMPQLRHLFLDWNYLQSYETTKKSLVLKNLQCLSGWNPCYCTGSVFRLFPNLKKLQIRGIPKDFNHHALFDFCNLDQLEELEFCVTYPRFGCFLDRTTHPEGRLRLHNPPLFNAEDAFAPFQLPHPNNFPQNLKNLAFSGTFFCWKDLSGFGKLPKLESIKLGYDAFQDKEWEIVDEVFPRLKFLLLEDLEIRHWRASCDNFPCLERLFLKGCWYLDSIPQDFADITTLALIDIWRCAKSVENSAKQIQQDMQDNYAISIEVHIH